MLIGLFEDDRLDEYLLVLQDSQYKESLLGYGLKK